MAQLALAVDHSGMSERGFHYIADDLDETWLVDWTGAGVAEIEDYLDKHDAFRRFLAETNEA